jgi:hypothetical protein
MESDTIYLQAGNVSMSATANVSKAFMVGAIGNDWLYGSGIAESDSLEKSLAKEADHKNSFERKAA